MRHATVSESELTVRSAECQELEALVGDQAAWSRHIASCQWIGASLFDGFGHNVDELSTGIIQVKKRGAEHGCK